MTGTPLFLDKYRGQAGRERPNWEVFGAYLDRLDAADWLDFMEDLVVTRSAAVREVVAPPPGTGRLEYAATLLEQCSAVTLGTCARALDQVVARTAEAAAAGEDVEPVLRALRLTEMLGPGVRAGAAAALVMDRRLPDEVREEAAMVVADRETHLQWSEMDLERDPFLLPAVVVALTPESPRAALAALASAPVPPPDRDALDYPARMALRRLCRAEEGGVRRAAEWLRSVSAGHWSRDYLWDETLQLREFMLLRQELGVEEQAPAEPEPPAGELETLPDVTHQLAQWLDDANRGPSDLLVRTREALVARADANARLRYEDWE